MYLIQIRTIGEVSFPVSMEATLGYRYDIPFDSVSLPCLPVSEAVRLQAVLPDNVMIGKGYPGGYMELAGLAARMVKRWPGAARFIRSCFTRERYDEKKGYGIRSLKPGLLLEAPIRFDPEDLEAVEKAVEGISFLGIRSESVTGEVSMRLLSRSADTVDDVLPELFSCRSLNYTLMLISPACFSAPFRTGGSTELYVPGRTIREHFLRRIRRPGADSGTASDTLRCTNAYLSDGHERLLPTPVCMSVVKLDRKQLHYRMASGKDPSRTEQDVALKGTFTKDVQRRCVRYSAPVTERIVSPTGKMVDALRSGQLFSGIVYGTDEEIRALAESLKNDPFLYLGDMSKYGFGEAFCRVDEVCESPIPAPVPASRFDLCCASDVLLLNGEGVPACQAEDLLKEAEYVLRCPGKLRIVSKYTGIHYDFTALPGGGHQRNVTRCLSMGSVIRLETAGGETLDISPLLHGFIGERTGEGYGEMIAYPALEEYYRTAENRPPVMYEINSPTPRDISFGAHFASTVMKSILKERVRGLALADREEYKRGVPAAELIPWEILQLAQDLLYPLITEEELKELYLKGLEENADEFDPN